MNKLKSRIHSSIGILTIAIAMVAWSASAVASKNGCMSNSRAAHTVYISLDSSGDPQFDDHVCPSAASPKAGDICVADKVRAILKFRFARNSADDWEFVRIELGEDDTNWPGTLPAGVYSDFEFDTDAGLAAGHPYVDLSRNKRVMEIRNNNCHQFGVHYRVILKDPEGNEHPLHPIMDNKGTGI